MSVSDWQSCPKCALVYDPCEAHASDPYPQNLFPHGLIFMSRVIEPDEIEGGH